MTLQSGRGAARLGIQGTSLSITRIPTHIDAGETTGFDGAPAVAHQTACSSELAKLMDRRHPITERQCGELFKMAAEEGIGRDGKSPPARLLRQACKHHVEFALGARVQDLQVDAEKACCRLRVSHLSLC
jgi:hypothetical protein